ncbi:farnesyl pyrophosphate synthase-like [Zophobas morio]|uniref:farnesyl pyrophosphate synthase-like n=1 Tax=Zophobas morio TaxID=2755281 RepID=UPI003082DF1B
MVSLFNKNNMQFWRLCTRQIATTQIRWLNINQNSMKTPNASLDRISSERATAWNSKFLISAEKYKEFLDLFPVVVNEVTNNTTDPQFAEANTRCDELLHYLAPFGKKLRGFITFLAYEALEKPENLTPGNRRLAMLMAWALEILHSACLIADDIIDEGVMRRGSLCWHRKKYIGFKAANDALLLEQGGYLLLRKYFRNHHCYLPSMLLLHDIIMRTALGEVADCLSVKDGKPQLQLFTMDRFNRIAEYKTGFYTFYLPIGLAMYMANIYDLELHRKSEDLSKDLTFLYQVQDDFLDCYGNPEKSGKKGTDIQEGKCTWLAVMAMKKGNHSQIETMKQCYGSKDPEAITTVLNLFEELNLKDIYQSSVDESVNHIRKNIMQNISNENLQAIYFKILKAIEQRSC